MKEELKELQEKKEQVRSEVESYAKAEYEVARLRLIGSASHVIGSLMLRCCSSTRAGTMLACLGSMPDCSRILSAAHPGTVGMQQSFVHQSYSEQAERTQEYRGTAIRDAACRRLCRRATGAHECADTLRADSLYTLFTIGTNGLESYP